MNKIIEEMTNAKAEYVAAQTRGAGIAGAKERMKNIAFNYYDQLIDAAKENISLREEVESLDEALANADEELKELKKPKKKAGKTEE